MEMASRKDSLERDWPHVVRSTCVPFHASPTLLLQKSDECAPTMTINFVLLQSPLLSPHDPEVIIVSREHQFIRGLSSIIILIMHQRSSVPIHPFRRFFGILAGTRAVHVSLSNRILTSICVALQMRAHIRLCFSATHFKTQVEHLNTMTLSMFSLIGRATYFLIPNTNSESLVTSGC